MKTQTSKSSRRLSVVIHYITVTSFMVVVYVIEARGVSVPMATIGIVTLIIATLSGLYVHVKTGLWKFVHTKPEDLDEREIGLTREAYRRSYLLFTEIGVLVIAPVAIIVTYTGLDQTSPSLLPMVFALVYIANSLPSSFLAWTEREAYHE